MTDLKEMIRDAGKMAAPTVQGEPVAWLCEWESWQQYHDESDPMPEAWDNPPTKITPLYAAPQPAPDVTALVEALEKVIKAAPSRGPLWHGSEQIVEARAALAAHRNMGGGE